MNTKIKGRLTSVREKDMCHLLLEALSVLKKAASLIWVERVFPSTTVQLEPGVGPSSTATIAFPEFPRAAGG